jgi:hypothetical protein
MGAGERPHGREPAVLAGCTKSSGRREKCFPPFPAGLPSLTTRPPNKTKRPPEKPVFGVQGARGPLAGQPLPWGEADGREGLSRNGEGWVGEAVASEKGGGKRPPKSGGGISWASWRRGCGRRPGGGGARSERTRATRTGASPGGGAEGVDGGTGQPRSLAGGQASRKG